MLRRCPHTTPTNMDFRVQSAISDIYPIAREVDFIELFQLLTVLFLFSLPTVHLENSRLVRRRHPVPCTYAPVPTPRQQMAIMLTAASQQCIFGS